GLESFDYGFRETVLKKGMGRVLPEEAGRYFQWANLLCGLSYELFFIFNILIYYFYHFFIQT
ncbi:MAG: hypothetical protein LBN41_02100, partial [Enterobacteriaceae bacterium]|nr:hypothetical protein [Enterobacteriaceae bacterium]